jgi:hypothetical protein
LAAGEALRGGPSGFAGHSSLQLLIAMRKLTKSVDYKV